MFSYDKSLTEPKDRVRFYIQDTKENDFFFEDEEIEAMLADNGGNPKTTAIGLCYTLAALFAGVPDSERVGPYSVSYKDMSDKFTKLAISLRAQQNRLAAGFAGGLNLEKTVATYSNKELTRVAFHRYMMNNKRRAI